MKCIKRRIAGPDDPVFKSGPQVFVPISRPRQLAQDKTAAQLLDELKDVGEVKRRTVERSMREQLERGRPSKK